MGDDAKIAAARIVVVMPNWLGDGVMATPFLRGLRELYPTGRIAAVARGMVAAVCEGLVDEVKVVGKGEEGGVAKWMRGEGFELGVLLPNSFRSAWMLWRGGVRRRLGYARGGRSWLLTDRVAAVRMSVEQRRKESAKAFARGYIMESRKDEHVPLVRVERLATPLLARFQVELRSQEGGTQTTRVYVPFAGPGAWLPHGYEPVPTIAYYLELARYLGAQEPGREMGLVVSEAERAEGGRALGEMGIGAERYVVMVPGANFGASKCWMPERFAAVAEQLADPAGPFGVRVILAGSPGEAGICAAIVGAMQSQRERVAILSALNGGKGVSIGALKEIVRGARLMVCNDTGPRHFAAAFGVPVVTLFGPTDPVWAETFFVQERIVRVAVPCGPCQLKVCPIDHRCMKGITVERVMEAVREVWCRGN